MRLGSSIITEVERFPGLKRHLAENTRQAPWALTTTSPPSAAPRKILTGRERMKNTESVSSPLLRITALERPGSSLFQGMHSGFLAEAHASIGEDDCAIELLDKAIAQATTKKEGCCEGLGAACWREPRETVDRPGPARR
ncbi:MAG: hypothetical protein IPI44_23505 [Sulfuritalea sp.]|nr:hypothetical protein [Sulfuritalea sp.]